MLKGLVERALDLRKVLKRCGFDGGAVEGVHLGKLLKRGGFAFARAGHVARASSLEEFVQVRDDGAGHSLFAFFGCGELLAHHAALGAFGVL